MRYLITTVTFLTGLSILSPDVNAGKEPSASKQKKVMRNRQQAPYAPSTAFKPIHRPSSSASVASSGFGSMPTSAASTPPTFGGEDYMTPDEAAHALLSLNPVKQTEQKIELMKWNASFLKADQDWKGYIQTLKSYSNQLIEEALKPSFEKRKRNSVRYRKAPQSEKEGLLYEERQLIKVNRLAHDQVQKWIKEMKQVARMQKTPGLNQWIQITQGTLLANFVGKKTI